MKGDIYLDVLIDEAEWGDTFRLLIAKVADQESVISYLTPSGDWKDYEVGVPVETLKLRRGQMEALAKRMVEWANRKNMHTDSEQKLTGKLEATNYHLEDLRALLKLKKR